ncbi:Crp/Fnr family transcriptional regulator [Sphingobium nicotianae]|uniref:Crp/Fnr family transcriptional regulator n=1 Tax=Sphingobium nicotianae TaxID=2782607 RepID=A0A9X1ISL9_9SPHN|nr:Crp/Fnr family transcriptional regulator [Sphingobium nicotianae]MBT2188731.1 Crp/Fnr family transcriptional regulator [Sphingobium nicotianae]
MVLEDNNLIAAMNRSDRKLLSDIAEIVEFKTGKTIYDPGDVVKHAFFPLGSSVASFLVVMDEGSVIETAMVGREGAIGGIVSQGRIAAYARSSVMNAGSFARIACTDLEEAKNRSSSLKHFFTRYADCLVAQIFQSVACNATHKVEARAAKWLAASVERTGLNDIVMTQEQFASILGVGRSYASRQIQRLKGEGLIRTRRGGILVKDYEGLRRRACGCNDLVRAHFDEVLAGVYPETVAGK